MERSTIASVSYILGYGDGNAGNHRLHQRAVLVLHPREAAPGEEGRDVPGDLHPSRRLGGAGPDRRDHRSLHGAAGDRRRHAHRRLGRPGRARAGGPPRRDPPRRVAGPRTRPDAMRLEVHAWGAEDAPPVVCLHGVTGHGVRFRDLAADHLPARRVLAPDLRGHGASGWDPPWDIPTHLADVIETLDAAGLGERPLDLVGFSFGGRLTLELAAREPNRVRRMALLDPAIQI